jgi:hypothetical protein
MTQFSDFHLAAYYCGIKRDWRKLRNEELHHDYMDHQTKEDEMSQACGMYGRRNVYRFWRGNRKED